MFVVNLLLKLQEQVPIQYAFVKNSFSINPNNLAIQSPFISRRFIRLADLLYSLKFISSFVADNAKFGCDSLTKKVVNEKSQFLSLEMRK